MAAKKRLSDSVVVNLLQQMLDSQNDTRESLAARLDALVAEQRATNERLDHLQQALRPSFSTRSLSP